MRIVDPNDRRNVFARFASRDSGDSGISRSPSKSYDLMSDKNWSSMIVVARDDAPMMTRKKPMDQTKEHVEGGSKDLTYIVQLVP